MGSSFSSRDAEQTRDERALAYLRLFGPDTYGLSIPHDLAVHMEQRGWVAWVPPKFCTTLYEITDAGRAHVLDRPR